MIDDKIHVAIRSYKRAGNVKTLKVVPFAWVWVPDSQADDYRAHYGDRVIVIPDELDGNPARKNNAILDHSPCPWTLMLDDDITGIGKFEEGESSWLKPSHIRWMIEQGFTLADGFGVKMWGINLTKDGIMYDTYEPFNLLCPILGPFHGHLEPNLRYDETTLAKEEYDFWLQNIMVHRRTLRLCRYHYIHAHGILQGGIVSMRTFDYEKRGVRRMRQKWGDKVFKAGGTAGHAGATGKNILNSRISIPIPGC
jgi:hypothetical protein